MKICKAHLFTRTTRDFEEYKCSKCNETFYASSCPSHKVCDECSDKYNLCIYCGTKIDTNRQYNIITAPKQIKLSEIVEKLNCQVERYNEYINLYDDTYEEDDIRDYYLFIKNNKIDEIHILPTEEFKWLYRLWIAETIIEDDMKGEE